MTPETEKNINEAIDWLQQTGGSVQDFAVEQAPLYCREVVAWELWSNALFSIAGVGLVYVAFVFLRKSKDWDYDDMVIEVVFPFGALITALAGLIMICECSPDAIKAALSPRLVIVEHLRGLK